LVVADTTRSQLRNREIARERLGQILGEAADRPRRRKATRPTASSRERRLDDKRRRSETKKDRRGRFD
jgi:ribosome-associated protein